MEEVLSEWVEEQDDGLEEEPGFCVLGGSAAGGSSQQLTALPPGSCPPRVSGT